MAQSIDIKQQNTPSEQPNYDHDEKIQDMEVSMQKIFQMLDKDNSQFSAQKTFQELMYYLTRYDRILYSAISTIIYARYEHDSKKDPLGSLTSNLEKLVSYSEDLDKMAVIKNNLPEGVTSKAVDKTRKVTLKLLDHVRLAGSQYTMLKQSDKEYDEKFQSRISSYKEEMTKEMNAQMITMVGIFTALAFLIFGSISSLDGIFENLQMSIFKAICLGLIWGLCVSNMIFVFLYCIGKMTKLSFQKTDYDNATVFQRYPIVWWTNFILISLLLFSGWGLFIQKSEIATKIMNFTNCHPTIIFITGSLIIVGIIFFVAKFLMKKIASNSQFK